MSEQGEVESLLLEDRAAVIAFSRTVLLCWNSAKVGASVQDSGWSELWPDGASGSHRSDLFQQSLEEIRFSGQFFQQIVVECRRAVSSTHVHRLRMHAALQKDSRWSEITFRQLMFSAIMLLRDPKLSHGHVVSISEMMHVAERVLIHDNGVMVTDVSEQLAKTALHLQRSSRSDLQGVARAALFHALTLSQSSLPHDKSHFYSELLDEIEKESPAESPTLLLLVGMFVDFFDKESLDRLLDLLLSLDKLDMVCSWVISQVLRRSVKSPQLRLSPANLCLLLQLSIRQIENKKYCDLITLTSQNLTECMHQPRYTDMEELPCDYWSGLASCDAMTICWRFAAAKVDHANGINSLVQCCPGQRQHFLRLLATHFNVPAASEASPAELLDNEGTLDDFVASLPDSPSMFALLNTSCSALANADTAEVLIWPKLWRLHAIVLSAMLLHGQVQQHACDVVSFLLHTHGLYGHNQLPLAFPHRCIAVLTNSCYHPLSYDQVRVISAISACVQGQLATQLNVAIAEYCIGCIENADNCDSSDDTSYIRNVLDGCLADKKAADAIVCQSTELIQRYVDQCYTAVIPMRTVCKLADAAVRKRVADFCCELGDLVVKHDSFAGVIKATNDSDIRSEILGLILTVCRDGYQLDHSTLKVLHSGYNASVSKADRLLFEIFCVAEEHGSTPIPAWANCVQCFTAFGTESQETSLLAMLDSQEGVTAVKEKLTTAILDVPAINQKSLHTHNDSTTSRPDASFLLPFCATVLRSSVDSRRCIELGCAGYVVSAMSSPDLEARKIAYHALAAFLDKVTDESTFAERFRKCNTLNSDNLTPLSMNTLCCVVEIMLLLHAVRMGVTIEYQVIPTVVTSWIRSAIRVLLRPDHALYTQVNAFLLQRPFLDVTDVPMFYSMFNSSDKEYKTERAWILHVLEQGVAQSGVDVALYRRRHVSANFHSQTMLQSCCNLCDFGFLLVQVFELLMTFFHAEHADAYTCKLVLSLLKKCCDLPEFHSLLIERHALVPWLATTVSADRLELAGNDKAAAELVASSLDCFDAALNGFGNSGPHRRRSELSAASIWEQFAAAGRTMLDVLLAPELHFRPTHHSLVSAIIRFISRVLAGRNYAKPDLLPQDANTHTVDTDKRENSTGSRIGGLAISAAELRALQEKFGQNYTSASSRELFKLCTAVVSWPVDESMWTIMASAQDSRNELPEKLTKPVATLDWVVQYVVHHACNDNEDLDEQVKLAEEVFVWLRDLTVHGSPLLFALWIAPRGVQLVRLLVSLAGQLAVQMIGAEALEVITGTFVFLLDAMLRLSKSSSNCTSGVAAASVLLPVVETVLTLSMERLPSPATHIASNRSGSSTNVDAVVAARTLLLTVLLTLTEAVTNPRVIAAKAMTELRAKLTPLVGLPTTDWTDNWRPVVAAVMSVQGQQRKCAPEEQVKKKRKKPRRNGKSEE
eukprot:SAG31_NODE_914_length_11058_cov_13.316270_4_plen_1446_part_00